MSVRTPSRKSGRGMFDSARRALLFRVGLCLILLGLIGFSVYQCTGHITMGMETLRTQEITESSYVGLELYVFRDEAPVTVDGNLFAYDVENGQKVGKNTHVLTAYRDTDPATKQAMLDTYAARMAWVADRDGGGTISEVTALSGMMDQNYLAMLSEGRQGHLAEMFGYADAMLESMNRYDALTGGASDTAVTSETLEAERAALLSTLISTDTLTASQSGYFYYRADGYEALFDPEMVMTMTPDEFQTVIKAAPETPSEGTAGKMVYSATWYGAAYVPTADADVFLANRMAGVTRYRVICADSRNTELLLELERLEYTADGALLVFSSCSMPEGFDFSRRISVETEANRISGYRIPAEAVVTVTADDGKQIRGVYILEGNVVEFRRIGEVRRYDGYLIARTYEEEQARLETMDEAQREAYQAQGYDYLQMNDNIITRGTGLYHGKMMG